MAWWIDKKMYPDYWKAYLEHFEGSKKYAAEPLRIVVLDTETTGFDFALDRLLCIGAVTIFKKEISVTDTFEIYIKQEHFNPQTVEIHGLIHNTKIKTVSEEEAIIQFLDYIKDAILVAHHAVFDIKMINMTLHRLGLPKLKNKVIDTKDLYAKTRIKSNFTNPNKAYTLDEIAENYGLDLSDRHTASGDALITAFIFLRTTAILSKSKTLNLASFFIKPNRF